MTASDLGAAWRCSGASLLRDEPIAGTASTVKAFLLVEHTGSWGVNALRDARLPHGLGNHLLLSGRAAGVRVLLARRPDRSGTGEVRVHAAYADPVSPWLESAAFGDVHEVLDLDLRPLGRGRSIGLEPAEGPMFAVCTHGKHDACCAERGRPVAAALEAAHPEETWEVSHLGGDRFAANMVVLPFGLYYGRLDPVSAIAVAGSQLSGHLELDHLRGRSGLPTPVQVAEIALRRHLEETRGDAVRYVGWTRGDEGLSTSRFEVAGTTYAVRVRTRTGERERLTCQAVKDNPIPVHEVVDISTYS